MDDFASAPSSGDAGDATLVLGWPACRTPNPYEEAAHDKLYGDAGGSDYMNAPGAASLFVILTLCEKLSKFV